jgi:hypothetical protein
MAMVVMAWTTAGHRLIERHAHDLAVTHAPLGDDMLAEMLHVIGLASKNSDLEAGVMVEMDVQRGER